MRVPELVAHHPHAQRASRRAPLLDEAARAPAEHRSLRHGLDGRRFLHAHPGHPRASNVSLCQQVAGFVSGPEARAWCTLPFVSKATTNQTEAPASPPAPAAEDTFSSPAPSSDEGTGSESVKPAGSTPGESAAAPSQAAPPSEEPHPSGFERFKRFWLTDLDGR